MNGSIFAFGIFLYLFIIIKFNLQTVIINEANKELEDKLLTELQRNTEREQSPLSGLRFIKLFTLFLKLNKRLTKLKLSAAIMYRQYKYIQGGNKVPER